MDMKYDVLDPSVKPDLEESINIKHELLNIPFRDETFVPAAGWIKKKFENGVDVPVLFDIKEELEDTTVGTDLEESIDIKHEPLNIQLKDEVNVPLFYKLKEEIIDTSVVVTNFHNSWNNELPNQSDFVTDEAGSPSTEKGADHDGQVTMEGQTFVNIEDPLLDTRDVSKLESPFVDYNKANTKSDVKKLYTTQTCMTTFKTKSNLKSHLRTDAFEKQFFCSICDKRFSDSSSLDIHKCVDKSEQPLVSGNNRSTQSELITNNRIHSRERTFQCDVCKKSYFTRRYLSQHILIHSVEKTFSGKVCAKRFNSHSSLTVHKRVHSMEKPFICKFCEKRFISRSNLTKHIHIHTGEKPFSCEFCVKRFSYRSNLTEHIRIHTGEKPFSCKFCEKRFISHSNLAAHIRTHTAEKPVS